MTETNQDKVQDRLQSLRKPPPKPSLVKTYGPYAAVLVAGLGIGGYVASVPAAEEARPEVETSESAEFQEDLGMAGFTTRVPRAQPAIVTPQAEPEPVAEPVALVVDPEAERLRATLAELQAQMEALRNKPAEASPELAALQAEMDSLRQRATDQENAYAELERENLRLQTQLGTQNMLGLPAQEFDDGEAQRLADLEARRAAAEAQRIAQNGSPMVAYRAGGSGTGAQGEGDAGQRYEGDEAFVRAGATRASVTQAEVIANPSKTVVQGTLIEATLQTAIQSSLEGNVIATVSYDVFSMDMSNVVIPRGSKLFGRYSSDIDRGQRRVLVAWDRVVTPDGQSAELAAYGTDRIGRSGLTGKVRNHTFARFMGAAAVSVIGGIPAILTAALESETDTGNRRDSWSEAASDVAQNSTSALSEVMQGYLDIPTTISIDQGAVVMVQVNADVEML
ncbi:TrbI/VirB10 family protein [Paracoccus sulfuroxidans]|uniref:Type IV secretion system protein VirB10 n=1 Tax=Paracoccus sulfuroxidans TaxID=384678 RepID=A0A562N7X6_9RHOB|nr:TrbI/VirB10 family protein [Paracoccus sulfuroxidans]TWI28200.1 type IV secretion system protein VirB10 [Paracoccus sulfuroxidans]